MILFGSLATPTCTDCTGLHVYMPRSTANQIKHYFKQVFPLCIVIAKEIVPTFKGLAAPFRCAISCNSLACTYFGYKAIISTST